MIKKLTIFMTMATLLFCNVFAGDSDANDNGNGDNDNPFAQHLPLNTEPDELRTSANMLGEDKKTTDPVIKTEKSWSIKSLAGMLISFGIVAGLIVFCKQTFESIESIDSTTMSDYSEIQQNSGQVFYGDPLGKINSVTNSYLNPQPLRANRHQSIIEPNSLSKEDQKIIDQLKSLIIKLAKQQDKNFVSDIESVTNEALRIIMTESGSIMQITDSELMNTISSSDDKNQFNTMKLTGTSKDGESSYALTEFNYEKNFDSSQKDQIHISNITLNTSISKALQSLGIMPHQTIINLFNEYIKILYTKTNPENTDEDYVQFNEMSITNIKHGTKNQIKNGDFSNKIFVKQYQDGNTKIEIYNQITEPQSGKITHDAMKIKYTHNKDDKEYNIEVKISNGKVIFQIFDNNTQKLIKKQELFTKDKIKVDKFIEQETFFDKKYNITLNLNKKGDFIQIHYTLDQMFIYKMLE